MNNNMNNERAAAKVTFKRELKEAKQAAKELYSIENIDLDWAGSELTAEDYIKSLAELMEFNSNLEKKLNAIVINDDDSVVSINSKKSLIGIIMNAASTAFNYDNPILNYFMEVV